MTNTAFAAAVLAHMARTLATRRGRRLTRPQHHRLARALAMIGRLLAV